MRSAKHLLAALVLATPVGGNGSADWFAAVVPTALVAAEPVGFNRAFTVVDEYKTPGLECELSGISPHPTDGDLYYVMANSKPPYRYGQKPVLPERYRGKLLTVDRQGIVRKAIAVADDDYGGLARADNALYVALTNAAEVRKIDPETGATLRRIPLPSPAGGLGYDRERNALIAQLYVGHPHLAVIDLKSGAITETLWSDESAMDLAKVDGDWLCTWASGWDPGSSSELRVLDQKTGKFSERAILDRVHTTMAPCTDGAGKPGFLCLVTLDSRTGETAVRRYRYVGQAHRARPAADKTPGRS